MNNSVDGWKKILLGRDAVILDAVKCLDSSALKIVLIVDESDSLLGTVTDGDIRRGLLDGLSLEDSISLVTNTDFLAVPEGLATIDVIKLMKKRRIEQIPVISNGNRVIGLHTWNDINPDPILSNTLVIMAGGRGARLNPQTESCPKPMLRVGGKPILEHIINRAKMQGFVNIVISVNYLASIIEDYFGDGEDFGVQISYLREKSPLGTAGSLRLLQPTPHQPIVVTNADLITELNFRSILEFHIKNDAIGTMAVTRYEWQNPFGVITSEGVNMVDYQEKPIFHYLINAGIYALDPKVLSHLGDSDHIDMPELFSYLRNNGEKTLVFHVNDQWMDVGTPADLLEANKEETKG